jgi:hypothetical protein
MAYVCTTLAPTDSQGVQACAGWAESALSSLSELSITDWQVILPSVAALWAAAWGLRILRRAIT